MTQTMPCAICDFPVVMKNTRREMYVDPNAQHKPDERVGTIAICRSKRCQRLVKEVLAEENRQRIV